LEGVGFRVQGEGFRVPIRHGYRPTLLHALASGQIDQCEQTLTLLDDSGGRGRGSGSSDGI